MCCSILTRKFKTTIILIALLEIFFLIMLSAKFQYSQHQDSSKNKDWSFSDIQMFVCLGFGLGFTSWRRNQVTGIYWTLVSMCISLQLLLSIQALAQDRLELSRELLEWCIRGSLPVIVGISVCIATVTPEGMVIFSLLGTLGFWFLRRISIQIFYPRLTYSKSLYTFDSSGTISIFLYGSCLGLFFTIFQRCMIRKNQDHSELHYFRTTQSRFFKHFGILLMLITWPVFSSYQISSPCMTNAIWTNTRMVQFICLIAAILFIQILKMNVKSQELSCMIGPIALGDLFDILPNPYSLIILGFFICIVVLAFGHFVPRSFLRNQPENILQIIIYVFLPALFGSVIYCLVLWLISHNIQSYNQSIIDYQDCFVGDRSPYSINLFVANFKTISQNQISMFFITILVMGPVMGLGISLISRCLEMELRDNFIDQEYFELEQDVQGLLHPGYHQFMNARGDWRGVNHIIHQ